MFRFKRVAVTEKWTIESDDAGVRNSVFAAYVHDTDFECCGKQCSDAFTVGIALRTVEKDIMGLLMEAYARFEAFRNHLDKYGANLGDVGRLCATRRQVKIGPRQCALHDFLKRRGPELNP